MEKLSCINCHQPVEQADGRVFAGVFVCPKCYLFADRLFRQGEQQLKQLLTVLKDAIRIALIEGKLTLPEASFPEELPKQELIQAIVQMQEIHNAAKRRAGS